MADVVRGGMVMLGIQRYQNLSVTGADGSIGTVRLINAGVRQSDVVENRLQFAIRNLLMQRSLDLVDQARRFFHTQARASPHMQTQQSRVYLREKILPEEHEQAK